MRKRLIAAVSAVAVLCLGVGIAFAQTGDNIYTVDLATTKPGKEARPSRSRSSWASVMRSAPRAACVRRRSGSTASRRRVS